MAAKKKKAPKKKNGLITVLLWFLTILVVVLCVMVAAMGYIVWCDYQVVFRDVTVELGVERLSIRDFMTDKAKASRVEFISDPSRIDLGKAGETELTLRHGSAPVRSR